MAERFFDRCFRPDPDSVQASSTQARIRDVCAEDLVVVYENTVLFGNKQIPGAVVSSVYPSSDVGGGDNGLGKDKLQFESKAGTDSEVLIF